MISLKRNTKYELTPAKGLRSRNIYNPSSKADFKISRGKLQLSLILPRVGLGIKVYRMFNAPPSVREVKFH